MFRATGTLLAVISALSIPLSAQDPADLAQQLAQERAARQELERALAAEREARLALEKRFNEFLDSAAEDDVEAQLRALLPDDALRRAPARTVFPGALNPQIGVFMDATIEGGSAQEKLGEENADRFSLRETEVDIRLPIAPFAEGVLITTFEDETNNDFHVTIEEGYANVTLDGVRDWDVPGNLKIGRQRVPFGHDNTLHRHDLLQVDRSTPVQGLLGGEGLIGDGMTYSVPVLHRESAAGLGRTTTAQVSLVNGEMFTGEESPLGGLAEDAGVELDSDASVLVGRLSQYVELDTLSDLEVGASLVHHVAQDAITADGEDVEPRLYALDATWRSRDDETGVGSWLLAGEAICSSFDFNQTGNPDFPSGSTDASGWSVTAQRQMSPTTYVGLRVGKSDSLDATEERDDISPYISWYLDEFFRVRLQAQRLGVDGDDGDETVHRAFLQFTWNFGAHQPHPYWVNK